MSNYSLSEIDPDLEGALYLLRNGQPMIMELSGSFRTFQDKILFYPDSQGVSKIREVNQELETLVSSLPGGHWTSMYWKTGDSILLSFRKHIVQQGSPLPLEVLKEDKLSGTVTFGIYVRSYFNQDYRIGYENIQVKLDTNEVDL